MRLCAYVYVFASVFSSVCECASVFACVCVCVQVYLLVSVCVCVMANNNGRFTLVVVLVAAA